MESTRAALVVAAHDFEDPKFQRLRSPAQDVDALAGVLGDDAIGGFEVRTVVNQPSAVVAQELERFFSGRKSDDLLLVYFSCHGVKDPAGRLYFVTSNTMFDLLRSTGISATFVSEQMEYSRSKRIVVLLDCCYSGAFLKGFRARGDDAVTVDQLEGRGRAVITASRATEYAFEADDLATENARPSVFTGAIVDGLVSGRADQNGDGLVTVDELYDYVYDAVRGTVAGQTPGRWIDLEGNLVVARNPRPPVKVAVLPAELQRALESDVALHRLGAVLQLTQWYHSGDAPRQLAAAPVLEQLTRDYDERVKSAARAGLAGAPARQPATPIPEPIPLTAPEAGIDDALEQKTGPALAPSEPAPQPAAPPPEPIPVTAPDAGIEDTLEQTAGRVPPPSEPRPPVLSATAQEAPGGSRPSRTLGWLAAIGGLAVLLSPYFDYLRFEDYASTLNERELFNLGTYVLFGMVACAAHCLLRSATSTGTGLAVLAGLAPVVAGEGAIGVGELLQHSDRPDPGVGWFLVEAGLALLLAAGILAGGHLRRHVSVSPRFGHLGDIRATGTVALALVIGAMASFGWAKLTSMEGDGLLGAQAQAQALVLRLMVIGALLCVVWRWAALAAARPALLWGATALSLGAVALFLAEPDVRAGKAWYAIGFCMFATGGAVVPALSTALVPARLAAVLLAAWAGGSAAWLPSAMAGDYEGTLLLIALIAAGALATVLATSERHGALTAGPPLPTGRTRRG